MTKAWGPICPNCHKTCTLGQNRQTKSVFDKTFYQQPIFSLKSLQLLSKVVLFIFEKPSWRPKGIGAQNRGSKSEFKLQITILQRAIWHTNYGIRFRGFLFLFFLGVQGLRLDSVRKEGGMSNIFSFKRFPAPTAWQTVYQKSEVSVLLCSSKP